MKILKKINDCFVALAFTTFVCIGPTVMPAFAAAIEDPDQTEEPLVSTPEVEDSATTASAGEDKALEKSSVEKQDESVAPEDKTSANEKNAKTGAAPAKDASNQIAAAAEAVAPNTFDASTADELKTAFEKVNSGAAGTYAVNLTADIVIGNSLAVSSGRTIDLIGNGHTLTLDSNTTLGTNGGTLNLNGALTITAAGSHGNALVTAVGGTLNMGDGVTITGNANGGVSLSNKATFNMSGGTIEHCQAHQGGGVNMDRNTTFTMSGNATIRDNKATNVGGGVYVNNRATFTMEGNASVVSNTADAAGGVMNYGLATLTTVYNNTTHNGAADIFNYGRMKLSPTNPDWVLSSTGTHVTGWYIDNYSKTDGDGNQGEGKHRWNPALDDSVEYVPTTGETREVLHLIAGAPLPEEPTVDVTWVNEDGAVLYKMTDVKASEIPAADEYTQLSGNANPTESYDDGLQYNFYDWKESENADGDVIYTAEYNAVPDYAPVVPDELVNITEPDVPHDDPANTPSTHDDPAEVPGTDDDPANVPSTHDGPANGPSADDGPADVPESDDGPTDAPGTHDASANGPSVIEPDHEIDATANEDEDGDEDDSSSTAAKMGDEGMALTLAATSGMAASLAGIAYIRHRRNKEDF